MTASTTEKMWHTILTWVPLLSTIVDSCSTYTSSSACCTVTFSVVSDVDSLIGGLQPRDPRVSPPVHLLPRLVSPWARGPDDEVGGQELAEGLEVVDVPGRPCPLDRFDVAPY